MATVLLLTVFVDLITAVAVGVVLASLLFVKRMSDLQIESIRMITADCAHQALSPEEAAALTQSGGRTVLYHLGGPFSFGAARGMARRLGAADEFDALILDLSDVPMVDSSAGLSIGDVVQQAVGRGKTVFIVGMRPGVRAVLERLGVLRLLPPQHVEMDRLSVLRAAAAKANPQPAD